MKVAVIADDLTGANDTGVQFAKRGLNVSVMLAPASGPKAAFAADTDVLVLDTDSRSLDAESARRKVAEASRCVLAAGAKVVFKKIDSTLRGNLGAELDAVYDVFRPDFVVVAPAYPETGRLVREGRLFVHGTLVHETEFARDPKTPVAESYIPELLRRQTKHQVAVVPSAVLADGSCALEPVLRSSLTGGIRYLVCDSADDGDLERIVSLIGETAYSVVWAGSAGLARHLSAAGPSAGIQPPPQFRKQGGPVLAVIGSVSPRSRRQLDVLLGHPGVRGIRMEAFRLVSGAAERERELSHAAEQAALVSRAGLHPVLYSAGDEEDVRLARDAGARSGMSGQAVSDAISRALGEAVSRLLGRIGINGIGGIVMTGGDTARQVCCSLRAAEFRLLDEVECGVPVGLLAVDGREPLPAVTKAGGFGSDQALLRALESLIGGIGTR